MTTQNQGCTNTAVIPSCDTLAADGYTGSVHDIHIVKVAFGMSHTPDTHCMQED